MPSGATLRILARVQSGEALAAADAPVRLRVAYEDAHLGVVVKPQGMPTLKMGVYKGPTAAGCIKFALTMEPVAGALR